MISSILCPQPPSSNSQQQMAMGMDTGKAFASVKENLEMLRHEFMLHVAERRAARLLRRLAAGAPMGDARAFANQ